MDLKETHNAEQTVVADLVDIDLKDFILSDEDLLREFADL